MIVFLAGPIEHWWDGNWQTPRHLRFVDWRDQLSKQLVARGHLVYRPHEAFKGAWQANGGAQAVNDRALELADLVLVSNFDPPVPCTGTDTEVAYVTGSGRCHASLVRCIVPDPASWYTTGRAVEKLLARLEDSRVLLPPPAATAAAAATWQPT